MATNNNNSNADTSAKGSSNKDDTKTPKPNPDDGDIIQAIEDEQNKTESVAEILLKDVFKELQKQTKDTRLTNQLLKDQLSVMTKIYNILYLWGTQGGITNLTHRGFNQLNPGDFRGMQLGQDLSPQLIQAVQEASKNLQESSDSIVEAADEMKKLPDTLKKLIDDSERRTHSYLDRTREAFSVSGAHLASSQDRWEKAVSEYMNKQKEGADNPLSAFMKPEVVRRYLEEYDYKDSFGRKQTVSDKDWNNLRYQALVEANSKYHDALDSLAKTIEDLEKKKDESEEAKKAYEAAEKEYKDLESEKGQDDFVKGHLDEAVPRLLESLGLDPAQHQFNNERRIESLMQTMRGVESGGLLGGLEGAGKAGSKIIGESLSHTFSSMLTEGAFAAILTPVFGPLAPVVGELGGEIIGKHIEETFGKAIDNIKEWVEFFTTGAYKLRDKIIEQGLDKIRSDVKSMATYQVEIYEQATQKLYSAWDKNLAQITATMGYTKDGMDELMVEVAQSLEAYSKSINVADYADVLAGALNANLNGELAKVFSTQSIILQKAIPEFNSQNMAEQFAAIWTRAEREADGSGKEMMVKAMEQVAGAIKAIEKTTDGNNQFIKQVPAYLTKAEEMVARAGGSVDKVADLTTQMMAAEGPLASLVPQLSGFTGELVSTLTDQNNSSAVALRAIMHDLNENIGITATDFLKSFMADTKGTLETAYRAIDEFITRNANPAAQQEFYESMSTLFGISADKLSQIDFAYIAEQLSLTNATLNKEELENAQDRIKEGEVATLEEQLVNLTSQQLMATNAVADTLDNALMRELEKHETALEKMVYEQTAVQSVDFAEKTVTFIRRTMELVVSLFDPLNLAKDLWGSVITGENLITSISKNKKNYENVAGMSTVGDRTAQAEANTKANTWGGAQAVVVAANLYQGNAKKIQDALAQDGVAERNVPARTLTSREGAMSAAQQLEYDAKMRELDEVTQLNVDYSTSVQEAEEQAKAEAEAKWDSELSAAQERIKEEELKRRAEQATKDESLTDIRDKLVAYEEDYLVPMDENIEIIANSATGWTESLDGVVNAVASVFDLLNEKWWVKDESFLDDVKSWLKDLHDGYPNTFWQDTKDYRSKVGTNVDNLDMKISDLKTEILNHKSSEESLLGVVTTQLDTIHTSQSNTSVTSGLRSAIKDSSKDLETKLQASVNAIGNLNTSLNAKQDVANQDLSTIQLNTSSTATNISSLQKYMENQWVPLSDKITAISNAVYTLNKNQATRQSDFLTKEFTPLSGKVGTLLEYTKDTSKNIIYGYLEDNILPSINAIRESSAGSDLKTVVDKLQNILDAFESAGLIGSVLETISTATSGLADTVGSHASAWDYVDIKGKDGRTLTDVYELVNSKDFSPAVVIKNE